MESFLIVLRDFENDMRAASETRRVLDLLKHERAYAYAMIVGMYSDLVRGE